MTPFSGIEALAAAHYLAIFGGFLASEDTDLPNGTKTLVLLGPAEPGFWPHFTAQPEWQDGQPDPMDRWSRRVIGKMACDLGAKALFPFGGPPWHPFYRWALRSGETWESPVRLLVNAKAGLLVSFRGALALKDRLDLPPAPTKPCDSCVHKPCLTSCPVGALTPAAYDLAACHGHLNSGPDCMNAGCLARRACPVSVAYARMTDHSAYHMRQFHK